MKNLRTRTYTSLGTGSECRLAYPKARRKTKHYRMSLKPFETVAENLIRRRLASLDAQLCHSQVFDPYVVKKLTNTKANIN